MKEPYESIVRRVAPLLSGLGFSVDHDDEYQKILRKDGYTIEFGTERYQKLLLIFTLGHASDDPCVGPMQIIDVVEALAPERLNEMRKHDCGSVRGLQDAIVDEVNFLLEFKEQVFVRPAEYRRAYEQQNQPDWG